MLGGGKMVERILSVSTIIFATFFLILSFQIESDASSAIGPSSWPLALMGMMLVLGIILTFNVFRNRRQKELSSNPDDTDDADDDDELVYPYKLYYLIIFLVFYTIGLHYVGFIVSTFILILLLTLLFGMNKWVNRLTTAIVSTASFIVLFPILLNLPFPRGIGFFREISILFY